MCVGVPALASVPLKGRTLGLHLKGTLAPGRRSVLFAKKLQTTLTCHSVEQPKTLSLFFYLKSPFKVSGIPDSLNHVVLRTPETTHMYPAEGNPRPEMPSRLPQATQCAEIWAARGSLPPSPRSSPSPHPTRP